MSSRSLMAAAVAAAAAAPVLGTLAGATSGATRTWLLVLAALVAALGVVVARQERLRVLGREAEAEAAAAAARDELVLAVGGALGPASSYLGALAAAPPGERQALVGRLTQAVVIAVASLTVPESRGALYLAQPDGRLVRSAWAGRAGEPRPEFTAETEDGRFVLGLVERGQAVLVGDVTADPVVTPGVPGSYDSVVAAPVLAGPQRLGLLTVDAPGVGALTRVELELVKVLASLLGAGLAQADGVASTASREAE